MLRRAVRRRSGGEVNVGERGGVCLDRGAGGVMCVPDRGCGPWRGSPIMTSVRSEAPWVFDSNLHRITEREEKIQNQH